MSKITFYTHREFRDAVLPRDILDTIGAPTWVLQGHLLVLADTAVSASHALELVGIRVRARNLAIAHGDDVAMIDRASDYPPGTVLAYAAEGGTRSVFEITSNTLGLGPTGGRIIRRVGELRPDSYRWGPALAKPDIEITHEMIEAALGAFNPPRGIAIGWLVRDMPAALLAALEARS